MQVSQIDDEGASADDLDAIAAVAAAAGADSGVDGGGGNGDGGNGDGGEGEEEDEIPPEEYVHVDERFYYLEYIIRILGITHAFVSLCMLVAYYNLKVPLAIFKREKEVMRQCVFPNK